MRTMRQLIEGLAGVVQGAANVQQAVGAVASQGRLSEQLGAFLAEYKTKGWSNVPDKSKKVWKVTPPGKKGVWRTLKNGRHVFFPQDGSGPIGGHPGHAGWAKGSGKFRAGPKKGAKQAKETKRGTR